jgi:hypothetical protein
MVSTKFVVIPNGQIGFDFVHDEMEDKIYVLECNPRTVSGIHFFSESDKLLDAFLGNSKSIKYASKTIPQMNLLTFLFYNGPKAIFENRFLEWLKAVYKGKDVINRQDDPKPLKKQFHSLIEFFYLSLKYRVKLSDAISYDIAWNGQGMEKKLKHQYLAGDNYEKILTG